MENKKKIDFVKEEVKIVSRPSNEELDDDIVVIDELDELFVDDDDDDDDGDDDDDDDSNRNVVHVLFAPRTHCNCTWLQTADAL